MDFKKLKKSVKADDNDDENNNNNKWGYASLQKMHLFNSSNNNFLIQKKRSKVYSLPLMTATYLGKLAFVYPHRQLFSFPQ